MFQNVIFASFSVQKYALQLKKKLYYVIDDTSKLKISFEMSENLMFLFVKITNETKKLQNILLCLHSLFTKI